MRHCLVPILQMRKLRLREIEQLLQQRKAEADLNPQSDFKSGALSQLVCMS